MWGMNTSNSDAELITQLGGPAKVAQLIGADTKRGGVQRVQNWRTRGIPAAVKVSFPHLFMPQLAHQAQTPSAQAATETVAGQGA